MAKLLVSLHDIHSGNYLHAQSFIQAIENEVPVEKIALLVVPRYQNIQPLQDQAPFCAWLKEKSGLGHEIFAHGFHHCTSRVLARKGHKVERVYKRNRWGNWINSIWVNYEAEFCGWPEFAKIEVMRASHKEFSLVGVPIQGFVAPTWHGSPRPESALEAGFQFFESRFFVYNLRAGRRKWVPPMSFIQPSQGPLGWVAFLGSLPLQGVNLLFSRYRLCLHPEDLSHKRLKRQIIQKLKTNELIRYDSI